MLLKACGEAYHAGVDERVIFATRNSLESQEGRKFKSPVSNIHAVPFKLCTDSRLTVMENCLASNLRIALNSP